MADTVDAVIKVKRGLESQRSGVLLASGELAYSTDVKRLFVGDGGYGGNPTSSQTYFGSVVPTYAIRGDFYVNTATTVNKLYILTGTNYAAVSSYALISDNTPAYEALTIVQTNSGSWGTAGGAAGSQAYTNVNANSAFWNSTYSVVRANSANWSSGSITGDQFLVNTVVKSSSANWNSSYTTVNTNSANWNNNFATATVTTLSSPVTASELFLVVNVGGVNRAIRLWDIV